jgi:hypothetical protein
MLARYVNFLETNQKIEIISVLDCLELTMNESIYVVKQPATEAMLETYYELDPRRSSAATRDYPSGSGAPRGVIPPKPLPTFLAKLRHWIHELRDFVVTPPPPREQVHLLVAPLLSGGGTKPSP